MDPKRKKILILYASAGHGHQKAAQAIAEALSDKGVETELLDTLTLVPSFFGDGYKNSYLYMIQHIPAVWGFFYFALDIPVVYFIARPFRRLVNSVIGGWIARRILQGRPQVVVSTHFMATEIASHLKRSGKLDAPLINVVTDYLAHAIWLAPGVDCYAGGSEQTLDDLRKRGVPVEKIAVTGIPVEKKFVHVPSKEECRAKLGIPTGAFTVLITSGGAGIGAMHAMARQILADAPSAHILAVCGTNKDLLEKMRLTADGHPNLHPFGFVNNVQELMAASDLVVGKGGGLTVSESLAIGRPLVLYGSVPGQETRNASCMIKRGAARVARSIEEVSRIVGEFAGSKELLDKYTRAATATGRPQAAKDIAELVMRHVV